MRKTLLVAFLLTFPLLGLVPAGTLQAQVISQTSKAGPVWVTLKILPAESFRGTDAKMKRDGGAKAVLLSSSPKLNHHMVVFLKMDKKPVERASVMILYRKSAPKVGNWTLLPVVRMHVAGKTLATTHFGNNVDLAPGDYEVIVVVNHNPPADFHFKLKM